MKKLVLVPAAIASAFALSACSFSFTTAKVKASDIQTKVSTEIKAQTGKDASVSCPGDLEGKVGATLTCQAAVNGRTYPVNINVTEAKGTDIRYAWKLDTSGDKTAAPKPTPTQEATPTSPPTSGSSTSDSVPAEKLEEWVKEDVVQKDAKYADAVVACQGALRAKVGATQECRVTHGSGTLLYTVTVTGVEGRTVKYSLKEHG
ncbi:DUF4333 domain-containing protein [Mariniluteicoccus flavus]